MYILTLYTHTIYIYYYHIYIYTITGVPPPDLRERYRHEPDRRRPAEGGHQGKSGSKSFSQGYYLQLLLLYVYYY